MHDNPKQILDSYLHFRDGGGAEVLPVAQDFWERLSQGEMPQLDEGRLMSAFSFSAPWASWERHPSGEELVMLISGAATLLLEEDGVQRAVSLATPGAYVLVPRNVWHTAKASIPTTMLFLTPGAGTEHRPVAP